MHCYHIRHFDHAASIDWQFVPSAPIAHFAWMNNGFCPTTFAQLAWTPASLEVRLWSHEQEILRTFTEHQSSVCDDSCLEFFVNFTPLATSDFFNFEVNPNGAMLSAFGPPRYNRTPVDLDHWAPQMNICPQIIPQVGWGVTFSIPWTLVNNFEPSFVPKAGALAVGNFFKCGNDEPRHHYGMWNPVDVPRPDFHRPEFFGTLVFDA